MFFHSTAANGALIVDFVVDSRDFAYPIVQYHRQAFFQMFAGEDAEFAPAFIGKAELHFRAICIAITANAGAIPPQIGTRDS